MKKKLAVDVYPSDFRERDVLALISDVLADKSPQEFADWCGCDIDAAIEIFSTTLVCKMSQACDDE